MSARALLSLAPGFSPNSEVGLGSARAPRHPRHLRLTLFLP